MEISDPKVFVEKLKLRSYPFRAFISKFKQKVAKLGIIKLVCLFIVAKIRNGTIGIILKFSGNVTKQIKHTKQIVGSNLAECVPIKYYVKFSLTK